MLGIVEMPYDVHYVLELLATAGYPVEEIDQWTLYYFLIEVPSENFILDNYAINEMFEYVGIDQSLLDPTIFAEIKETELGIIDMPYEVNYILDLLWRVGYPADTV